MSKRNDKNERRPRGFYPTPRAAFMPLAPFIRGERVAEPCAGNGALCALLDEQGCEIAFAGDLVPQHPNVGVCDASRLWVPEPVTLVTNPPWPEPRRYGEPTLSILRNLATQRPTWLLLPADFMHNVYAAEPMRHCHHVISVGRVKWIEDSEHQGFDNCAWYLFDYTRPPAGGFRFTPRSPASKIAGAPA